METPAPAASEPLAPGDGLALVLGTYFVVLFPWTILFSHDFIAERWATVRQTRRAGQLHLAILVPPLPLILYYTVLQARVPDYKEMAMGITAVTFSLYHLLRACWGLWQLHCFVRWATNASECLHALGYPRQSFLDFWTERGKAAATATSRKKRPGQKEPQELVFASSAESVDALLVNESVIDNEIFGGKAPRAGLMLAGSVATTIRRISHSLSLGFLVSQVYTKSLRMRSFYSSVAAFFYHRLPPSRYPPVYAQWERTTVEDIDFLMRHADEGEDPYRRGYRDSCLGPRIRAAYEVGMLRCMLYPRDPEKTVVRWVVAFVAQRGVHWLRQCPSVTSEMWSYRRGDLVRSYAVLQERLPLRYWARFSSRYLEPVRECHDESLQFVTGFSLKHAMLDSVFESGQGLPHNFPSPVDVVDDFFCLFEPKHLIRDSVSKLPPKEEQLAERFTTAHLDIFAIITSLAGLLPMDATDPDPMSLAPSMVSPDSTSRSPFSGETDVLGRLKNARKASLGRSSDDVKNGWVWHLVRGAPSRLQALDPTKSNVVPIADAYLDNWIALRNGLQTKDLAKSSSMEPSSGFSERRQSELAILHASIEAERRNIHRPDLPDGCCDYSEKRDNSFKGHCTEPDLTFKGYVMKALRAMLLAHRSIGGGVPVPTRLISIPVPDEFPRFRISDELFRELQEISRAGRSGPNEVIPFYIKSRILYECQNAALEHVAVSGASGTHAVIACILGFPALLMEVGLVADAHDIERTTVIKTSGSYNCRTMGLHIVLKPVLSPQDFWVQLYLPSLGPTVTVANFRGRMAVVGGVGTHGFDWQDWKDAFEARCGRLGHECHPTNPRDITVPINFGEEWNGWDDWM